MCVKPRQELSAREVEALHEGLLRRLGDSSVPTLPAVAMKVIELVGNSGASVRDFVEVIQTDQALTGRLLRTANSAYYAQRAPVTQLQRAMLLLGLDRLKAMALGFHLTDALKGGEDSKNVWTQSLFRAWTAFRLAERFERSLTGEAFIIGLMLDAGLPMMPKLAGASYKTVVNPSEPPGKQYAAEFKELPFTHVDVVSCLCTLWKLPDTLAKPISLHHTAPDSVNTKVPVSLLQGVAYYVGSLPLVEDNAGTDPGAKSPMAVLAERYFGLSSADVQRVLRDATRDFKSSKELFGHIIDNQVPVEQILRRVNKELSERVENLVDQAIDKEAKAGYQRFEASGLIFEIVPGEQKRVTVYVADASGVRLLSEEIDPRGKSPDELRRTLMLEESPQDVSQPILDHLTRLAA